MPKAVLTRRPVRSAVALALGLCASLLPAALPVQAGASQEIGVQQHLLWPGVDATDVNRQLDTAVNLGASHVRVDVSWAILEQDGKRRYSSWLLSRLDHVVSAANSRGLRLVLMLLWSPCWASSAPDSVKQGCSGLWWERGEVHSYPPAEASHYADAIGYLASRYRGRVAAWEVWNEPNFSQFFTTPAKASEYAKIVKAAYPAVKASDPSSKVLAGSLSGADVEFTRALYAAGIKGSFDGFSIHPYSGDRSPLSAIDAGYSFVAGVPGVRKVMLANNDPKPLWITEIGWNTSDVRNQERWRNGVSELIQATYLELAFAQMRQWRYVPVGIWYAHKDMSSDRLDPVANYGLLRLDGSKKPSYFAFQRSAAALAQGAAPPPVTSPRKGRKPRLALRLVRGSALRVRGRTPRPDVLKIKARANGKARARLIKRIRLDKPGRFSRRIRSRALHRAPWVVATAKLVRSGTRDRVRRR